MNAVLFYQALCKIHADEVLLSDPNIASHNFSITRDDRQKLKGHSAFVIWMTGLSGAGKSTLADALDQRLHATGRHSYILDGDNLRTGLNKDLDFSVAGRVENIRRVAEVARLMMDAGLVVITSFISPFRRDREMARNVIGADRFLEVYVNTPLQVCEKRDPKGLYQRARAGHLVQMTGISSPYEEPLCPDFTVNGASEDPHRIAEFLLKNLQILPQ